MLCKLLKVLCITKLNLKVFSMGPEVNTKQTGFDLFVVFSDVILTRNKGWILNALKWCANAAFNIKNIY